MKLYNLHAILVGVMLSLCITSFGQMQGTIPPTPNATKMTEYVSQRPNMYTGTASVSIPLYTIDFDGWSLPLSLSYNATGIRTNEDAGEVGLGWALNATGVISRTMNSGDDFFKGNSHIEQKGYVYNSAAVTHDTGYKFSWALIVNGVVYSNPPTNSYYAKSLVGYGDDTEPDIFNFNFFGFSGSFLITQQVSDPLMPVLQVTGNACSIKFDGPSQTFTITTPDGFKGEFTAKERTTPLSGSIPTPFRDLCCGENNLYIQQVTDENNRFRNITSWYLTKITSPHGKAITFYYDLLPNGSSRYLCNSKSFAEFSGNNETCLQTIHEYVYLKTIDSEDVTVYFGMEDREDLRKNVLYTPVNYGPAATFPTSQSLKRYNSIAITGKNGSTLNKNIQIRQSYFNGEHLDGVPGNNSEDEVQWLRSRLDRVIVDDQEYRFTYEDGTAGLPNKLTRGIDHFGFYNGQDLNDFVLPPQAVDGAFIGSVQGLNNMADTARYEGYKQRWERRVDFEYGKAGLLKTVRYPTRGYTSFEYEPHSYVPRTKDRKLCSFYEQNSNTLQGGNQAGGARIRSIKQFDADQRLIGNKSYEYVKDTLISSINTSMSTGRILTPLYNRYAQIFRPKLDTLTWAANFIFRTNTSIPGHNAAEGKIIGYSRVQETVHGDSSSYKNLYYFENRYTVQVDFESVALSYPNLNGQLRESKSFNSSGQPVQRTVNKNYYHKLPDVKAIAYQRREGSNNLEFNRYYMVSRSFVTPGEITTTAYTNTSAGVTDSIKTVTTRTHNSVFLVNTEISADSKNDVITTEFRRPSDYVTTSPVISFMRSINLVNPVIEEIHYKNNKVISSSANQFVISGSAVNLAATYRYVHAVDPTVDFPNSKDANVIFDSSYPYEKTMTFSGYDAAGKLLEYKGRDGITHSFVWDNNLPVVHGIGITSSSLFAANESAKTGNDYDNALRTHPNMIGAQVTTYVHNPLVGVTKITNPLGFKTTYDYDAYGRLTKVSDQDSKILAQNKYHFAELPLTRILTATGSLEFGILPPDFFYDHTGTIYYNCSPGRDVKKITLSNTTEQDVTITSVDAVEGFDIKWPVTVVSGSKASLLVTFTGRDLNRSYSGNVVIHSNSTAGNITIPVHASYNSRICNLAYTTQDATPEMNFHKVTGITAPKSFTLTNNGNAIIKLTGSTTNEQAFRAPINMTCLEVGESKTFQVAFDPLGLGTYNGTLSVQTEQCGNYNDFIVLKGQKVQLRAYIIIDKSSVALGDFTTSSKTFVVNIRNEGTYDFNFTGLSFSNPSVGSYFTVSPATATVAPDQNVNLTVTYTPTAFGNVTTNIIFNNNATFGDETLGFSGNRYPYRNLILVSGSELVFDPGTTVSYKTMMIQNDPASNDNFSVSGVTPNTNVQGFSIDAVSFTTLTPGQSMGIVVRRTGDPSPLQNLQINATNTNGPTSFNIRALDRKISYPVSADLQSRYLPITQTFNVSNPGAESPLHVSSIFSTNSKFTVSPNANFDVNPGGNQPIVITYTPIDFTQQTSDLTFSSNAGNFVNPMHVSAQYTAVSELTMSTTIVNITPYASAYPTISNTGNQPITINSYSVTDNNNAFDISVTYNPSGTGEINVPFPNYVLAGTKQITIKVSKKTSTTLSTSVTGNIRFQTSVGERVITLSLDPGH